MSPHSIEDEGYSVSADRSESSFDSIPELNDSAKGTQNGFPPIAICGMACRLGGGIRSPEDLWEFLVNKGDGKVEVPADRYNIDAFYSPVKKPGTVITRHAYFIDDDLTGLDGSFFNMSAAEIERCDPQQRQMLEVAREAFEDAGVTGWRGSNTGVYMGSYGDDWADMLYKESQASGVHNVMGQYDFVIANRVSYEMDLRGPSSISKTACSSSFVALSDACLAIARGDCDAALVGGTSLILTPKTTILLTEFGALSPDGSSKAFSADANGYARGEAINAIYIKPLHAALRDGNPVRAVLRAVATNHDGKTPGLTTPGLDAQEALVRHAYKLAGIEKYSETGFFELHGTGTVVGDKIEANAAARVFGGCADGMHITSVKPNLGHTEGASGLTSLMKAVLALENRTIPPNIKFKSPNPNIPWETARFAVPIEPTPWPNTKKERVSVNNFGIGGTNGHAIVDSAASFNVAPAISEASDQPQLLVYSANSPESLQKVAENYARYLERHPERIEHLAYTLANRREHLPHRAFVVASREKPGSVSPAVKPSQTPSLVMVFTGQGAQWPQMGRHLVRGNSIFRARIQSLDTHLQTLGGDAPTWTIEAELRKPARSSRLHLAELSQPLCTAIQIALVDALAAIGVNPSAVVGHSSGEIAAAYAVGALTAEQAIAAAFYRGVVANKQQRKGAMAAIGMGWNDVGPFLVDNVGVACENSPTSVTISGDAEKVEEVVTAIQRDRPDVLARLLKVEKAYHSHHMKEVGEDYLRLMGDNFVANAPNKPFFSSVTGHLLRQEKDFTLGSKYWRANLESPVLFKDAVEAVAKHSVGKNAVYLEIGPHSALAGPLRQILAEIGYGIAPYISAMIRGENSVESFLSAVGKLYALHFSVNFLALYPDGVTLSDLPRYPWDHSKKYWHETRVTEEWRQQRYPYHDLLGVKTLESTSHEPTFKNMLHLDNAPWLRDHSVGEDIVFPFAGYIAIGAEAVRQITGTDEGYQVRNATATTALVTPEGTPVEIITSFRKVRIIGSLDSDWWEYNVSSYNGHGWTKHFTGEITSWSGSLGTASEETLSIQPPRKCSAKKLYETQAQSGMVYGPHFQGLKNLRSPTSLPGSGTATVQNNQLGDEANYHLHPTIVDFSIQLLVATALMGLSNDYRVYLATSVADLKVTRSSADLRAIGHASYAEDGSIVGDCQYVTDQGEVVLNMTGFGLTEKPNRKSTDSHASARFIWRPDINFQSINDLISPISTYTSHESALNELTKLSLVLSQRHIDSTSTENSHLLKYRSWVTEQVRGIEPTWVSTYAQMNDAQLEAMIQSQAEHLSDTSVGSVALALLKLATNITRVFSSEVEAYDLLNEDDLFNQLEEVIKELHTLNLLRSLSHSRPSLRVLELGAGTGTSTSQLLDELAESYSAYHATDSSVHAIDMLKDRFKSFPKMNFTVLDIGQSLVEQGFEGGQYDLIIANNVLHQTPNLKEGLANVHRLLSPNGYLIVQELSHAAKWATVIFGILPDWSKGGEARSTFEATKEAAAWIRELVMSGFEVDGVSGDLESQALLNTTIVARPSLLARSPTTKISLLVSEDSDVSKVLSVDRKLRERGYDVSHVTLNNVPIAGQDIISLLDLSHPFFECFDSKKYENLQNFVANVIDCGIFWPTRLSQMHVTDPRYGQVIGFARTIRNESGIDFAVCQTDLDFADDKIFEVFKRFTERQTGDILKPELEYVIANGQVQTGRYYPHSIPDELVTTKPDGPALLTVEKGSRLRGLHWERQNEQTPQGDEVQIDVRYIGLNRKDVLIATGAIDTVNPALGIEAAGVVLAVGPNVKKIRVGDRVMAFCENNAASIITDSESYVAKVPDRLALADAATMPFAYIMALYALLHVGGLEEGQSVLIHGAAGGVGLAALQIADMIGANVFATVGSDEKVVYLTDTYNIPRNHIFNSRNISFADALLRETGGRGVDLVLSPVSPEHQHATWRTVAEFGKLVDIGNKHLSRDAKTVFNVSSGNRSYTCIDIGHVRKNKPLIISRLLKRTLKLYSEGHIGPIRPTKIFPATDALEAIEYIQDGAQLGRVILELRNDAGDTHLTSGVTEQRRNPQFDLAASYLIVGGLGGLGRSVSVWMAMHGARSLIFLSRSAGKRAEDADLVHELESMGCKVQLVQGSVATKDDVTRAISNAHAPLKGILQMSMVLRDTAFANMSWDDWRAATECKVQGTWNLHEASIDAGNKLDFFVMFSSVSGIVGNMGQVNYNSANTFLDAFCQYRAGLGLAGSTLNCGVVEDVGVVAENQDILRRFREQDIWTIKERDVIDGLQLAMDQPTLRPGDFDGWVSPNTFMLGIQTTTPLSSPKSRAVFRSDPRFAFYHTLGSKSNDSESETSTASDAVLKTYIAQAKADHAILNTPEATSLLSHEIGKKVLALLVRGDSDVDTSLGLADLGIDSLLAIDMRMWWKQVFGFDISVLEMLGMGTLEQLGKLAASGLLKQWGVA
ncbi:polyketide synthase [Cucurbitaria berberidis CBS 394.84]|uniref:Polyketide synthase n=1 Tax=Cucurbitaria berberidis CBS 394.84 TaxID=1168544 RepID=A0A9P4GDI5_9PLEO|nr:polyketide synthase [Cucurbitaria berberidis CBS 394.84]KAF1843632.1 polyketide synthase [Cucurbitaria berberidis CBS 394.84]